MLPLCAALLLPIVLDAAPAPASRARAAPVEASNAARARLGLLPRKASPAARGRRGAPLFSPAAPTYLGEPIAARDEGAARALRLRARGVTSDVTLVLR